ncbi:hypothetical protein ACFY36_49475 [Actinoplanes sp. NPDC000266]
MSQLESTTRALLSKLLAGDDFELDPEDQATLSAWSFKTAVVSDLLGPDRTVPAVHVQEFYRSRRPPGGVYVHLSARRLLSPEAPIAQLRQRDFVVSPFQLRAYKAVIAIGHGVIQVIGFPQTTNVRGTELMALGAARIWPVADGGVAWPGDSSWITTEEAAASGRAFRLS